MRENIDNVTEDGSFEVLEFIGDVAVYATFSGYHNPISAMFEYSLGGNPVMFALHVVKYSDDTVFTSKGNANRFTEEEGMIQREFFRAEDAIPEEDGDVRTCHAYLRTLEVIESVKGGYMSRDIAPVEPGQFEVSELV